MFAGSAFTVTTHVAFRPFFVVIVIVAVPSFFAVIFPSVFTVAILVSSDFHVYVVSALFGCNVGTIV